MARATVVFDFKEAGRYEIPFDLEATALIEEEAGEPWSKIYGRWAGLTPGSIGGNARDTLSIMTGLLRRVRPETTREEVSQTIATPSDLSTVNFLIAKATFDMLPPQGKEVALAKMNEQIEALSGGKADAPKAPATRTFKKRAPAKKKAAKKKTTKKTTQNRAGGSARKKS